MNPPRKRHKTSIKCHIWITKDRKEKDPGPVAVWDCAKARTIKRMNGQWAAEWESGAGRKTKAREKAEGYAVVVSSTRKNKAKWSVREFFNRSLP